MKEKTIITKESGEQELFAADKLESSLRRAGAKEDIIESIKEILGQLIYDGITTKEIYKKAFSLLRREQRSIAARYSLKKAILQLGPTGFPFEHFVAQTMAVQGYSVSVGEFVQGKCITHEIDVLADKENTQCFVECKFHNSQGKFCNVQVPLYIRSRVDDIIKKRKQISKFKNTDFQGWIVTNTRFTSDAMEYGICSKLNLISWDYPKNKSLKDIVESYNIFPITVLTQLTKKQKSFLLEKGIVLCRQLSKTPEILNQLTLNDKKKNLIMREVNDLCSLNSD